MVVVKNDISPLGQTSLHLINLTLVINDSSLVSVSFLFTIHPPIGWVACSHVHTFVSPEYRTNETEVK